MIVYAETNFLLEMILEQEQYKSCVEILEFCETGRAELVIPIYCFTEMYEMLHRQYSQRRELQRILDTELRQLARTQSIGTRLQSIQDIKNLLIQSNSEVSERTNSYRTRILSFATCISLTPSIVISAAQYENTDVLRSQDAVIYASVLSHLQQKPANMSGCFLNRNSKDFDTPAITEELKSYQCVTISRFDRGLSYLQSHG